MKQNTSKHFPYQHPTFGTLKKPKPKSYWENTIYFVWWSYLKRSDSYLQTCKSKGKSGLIELYKDFGDVRGDDFKKWWTEEGRGARLFSEPESLSTISIVPPNEPVEVKDSEILIRVPLGFPKKYLEDRFSELLGHYHQGKQGNQYAKNSKAKYKFHGQPNIQGMKTALMVFDYIKENPKIKLWEVGKILSQFKVELLECEKQNITPSYDLKRKIEATVSRYKRKATSSIRNSENGVFP